MYLARLVTLFCLLGHGTLAFGADDVSIGVILNGYGQMDPYSPLVRAGIEAGLTKLKSSGVKVTMTFYDSKETAEGTVAAMEAALKANHTALIGEVRSNKALAAAEIAEKAKRFFITPMATSPAVTEGKTYVFRACFDDDFQGRVLADYAYNDMKSRTAAIVWDGAQIYSATLRDKFTERFVALGGKVVSDQKIVDNVTPLPEVIGELSKSRPDVLFLPLYSILAAKFFSAAAAHPKWAPLQFLGGDGWAAIKNFGDLTFTKERQFVAFWPSHFGDAKLDPALKAVHLDRESDATAAAIGFDTVMLLGEVLRAAGPKPTQEALATALRGVKDYRGLTGRFAYNGRQTPAKSIFMQKMQRDRRIVVKEIVPQ